MTGIHFFYISILAAAITSCGSGLFTYSGVALLPKTVRPSSRPTGATTMPPPKNLFYHTKRHTLPAARYKNMQNEPNFKNAKMNINYYKTTNYEQKDLVGQRKNEPKRTQFKTHNTKMSLRAQRGNLNRDIRDTTYAIRENKANLQGGKMNI